jgi:hypothetical protein
MPMDSKKIDELLNKYWECETSLEEEQQLREYFEGSNLPDQHKEAASLFRYFSQHKKKSMNEEGFEKHLLISAKSKSHGKVVQLLYNSMRIAAGIAVLVAAIYFVRKEIHESDPVAMEDTYDDPKLAFEETKKALMMISKGFTKAEQETRKINLFNEAQEEIQKKEEAPKGTL